MKKADYIKGLLALNTDLTSAEIAKKAGCSKRTVRRIKAALKPTAVKTVVGIIADTHMPAEAPGYFEFIKKTFKRFGVNKIVHICDVVDHHQPARHDSEPGADAVLLELKKAKKALKKWSKEFPEVSVCIGNHDAIPARQAKRMGMPEEFMKSYNDLLGLPEGWDFQDKHIIDDVFYEHGLGSGGMYGAKNTSLKYRMSYVQGHTHANAGVFYNAGPKDMIFGLNVGSGCNASATVMKYGQDYKSKITLGCGIVVDGKEGHFVPFIK